MLGRIYKSGDWDFVYDIKSKLSYQVDTYRVLYQPNTGYVEFSLIKIDHLLRLYPRLKNTTDIFARVENFLDLDEVRELKLKELGI